MVEQPPHGAHSCYLTGCVPADICREASGKDAAVWYKLVSGDQEGQVGTLEEETSKGWR